MDILPLIRDVLIATEGLGLSSGNCYVSPASAWVRGSPPWYVQVVDDGEQIGDQGGGTLNRRVSVKIALFVHMDLDRSGRAEVVLTKEADGLRARREAVLAALNGNWLKVDVDEKPTPQLQAPLWVESITAPTPFEHDPTWLEQDMIFVGRKITRSW